MILVDTGPLVALFSRRDEKHASCLKTMSGLRPPLMTTWPVITEAAYLIGREMPGAFNGNLLEMLSLDDAAVPWIARFLKKYEFSQLADASLVYLAEREKCRTIFTFDRHFSDYRTTNGRRLKVIPSGP